MPEVEIAELPSWRLGESNLVELHSLRQVTEFLATELEVVGLCLSGTSSLLTRSLALCHDITDGVPDEDKLRGFAEALSEHQEVMLDEIVAASAAYPLQATRPENRETVDNIRHLLAALAINAREFIAEAHAPGQWVRYPFDALRNDLLSVFAVMETTSHGRQRMMCQPERKDPPSHAVELEFTSPDQLSLAMPILVKDVVRDLVAGARRHTPEGGNIRVTLHEGADGLQLAVQDSGPGLAEDALASLARGFPPGNRPRQEFIGLGKAGAVAHHFGGQMWIRAEAGAGTTITLAVPRNRH